MAKSKRQKHCNVCANFYDGYLDFCFDCRHNCHYALSAIMTSDGIGEDVECSFCSGGNCFCQSAQLAALKALSKKIKEKLKEIGEEDGE